MKSDSAIRLACEQFEIRPLGESSLSVRFHQIPTDRIGGVVFAAAQAIGSRLNPGDFELVPGMESLAVHSLRQDFDVERTTSSVREVLSALNCPARKPARVVELPVCYEVEFAPDLAEVAARCGLSAGEVVRLHSATLFTVRLLGFAPGFPYLEGLPRQLHLPRRAIPRVAVPAGSVAIAAGQAGVYPQASPGGWHLIGRTPRRLFDPAADPPALLKWGDSVRFYSISATEFRAEETTP